MSESQDVVIFTRAQELTEPGRAAYLQAACDGDEDLRKRVERLLRAFEASGDFLDEPAAGAPSDFAPAPPLVEGAGSRVGRYKLLQQIGEGGCGIVFMAEQEEPIRRLVALKVIKPGMDTKNVIARFEAERQALALMDHPNIARVFDAGTTASGRPYFVMELVRGLKITDYCDQQFLPTAERLALFKEVCGAVQHAHQKGIIHRDIKPSNILITTSATGKPTPKVIDFGIAKATTGQRLTDKTLFTAFEMLIGTPAYMSPEQAELTSVDVDTRTDIYSLGVLLYELLTGTTPFDTTELLKSGLDEVRRAIRTRDPVRPSTRLSTMMEADLAVVSRRRDVEQVRLIRDVRGDLDWIVLKAMEKDRTRRFATVNEMAADLDRFLTKEPILARPPSALYKLKKLFQRNRILVVCLVIIFILAVLAMIVSLRLFVRERYERHLLEIMRLESSANEYYREYKNDQAEDTLRQSLALRKRYLNGEPPTPQAIGSIMQSMSSRNKQREAREMLDDILTPEVVDKIAYNDLLAMRAEIRAHDGRWQSAAEDATLVLSHQPDNNSRYHMLVPLLAATTNLEAYRQACSNIVFRFSAATNPFVADSMAKDCLILPDSGVDLKKVGAMATLAVTTGKGKGSYYFFQACQALASYRLGDDKSAVRWAEQSAENDFPYSRAEACAILAMAHHKLGNTEPARAALARCDQVIADKLPKLGDNLGSDWRDWIIAHTLQGEAHRLIDAP